MTAPYTYRILAKAAHVESVHPGESYTFPLERRILYAWPAFNDYFAQVIDESFDGEIPNAENLIMTFDHMLPVRNAVQEAFISKSKDWAHKAGIKTSEGEGIGHILAIEQGWVKPGMIVPHFDTHVSCIGAIGALGLGLLKEMLYPLATNNLWFEIPPLVRVELTGRLPDGIMGRDLLNYMIGMLGPERCCGKIIEFGGPGAQSLPLDDRITICNLINCLSAISGLFAQDDEPPDPAAYEEWITIDLGSIEPYLAAPPAISHIIPLEKAVGTHVDMGIIGTCAGGGLRDIEMAARILNGKRIASNRSLYVIPSTVAIYQSAIQHGYIQTLLQAGCFISSPTCDFCYGTAAYLGKGKTAISTQTLNVSGRLGASDSSIYLASSAAVAAALAQGSICDPRLYLGG